MKKSIRIIAAAAAAAAIMTACNSSEKSNVKVDAELPTSAETDSVSYLIGVNFGYFIKAEGDMSTPEFNESLKINPQEMNRLFNAYITKRNNYEAEVNKAVGEKFMSENKMKDGIVSTDSGLQYRIVEAGNDVKAGPKDTVWVHYTGTLIDGTEFDASDPAKEPVRMLLNRVIKGWTEGLQLVGEGGKIELFVPDSLAYGARKMGKIGPNSTLIFDVDVVKVGKVPAEDAKANSKK